MKDCRRALQVQDGVRPTGEAWPLLAVPLSNANENELHLQQNMVLGITALA